MHTRLRLPDAAATLDAAIAAVEAMRTHPPFSTSGKPCTLPKLFEGLSRRDGGRSQPDAPALESGNDAAGERLAA